MYTVELPNKLTLLDQPKNHRPFTEAQGFSSRWVPVSESSDGIEICIDENLHRTVTFRPAHKMQGVKPL